MFYLCLLQEEQLDMARLALAVVLAAVLLAA